MERQPLHDLEQLSELVHRFSGHGPAVHLDLSAAEMAWPIEVTATVCRLVQESLINVARHAAHAQTVAVSVVQSDTHITVEVADDALLQPPGFRIAAVTVCSACESALKLWAAPSRPGPNPALAGWSKRRYPHTGGTDRDHQRHAGR